MPQYDEAQRLFQLPPRRSWILIRQSLDPIFQESNLGHLGVPGHPGAYCLPDRPIQALQILTSATNCIRRRHSSSSLPLCSRPWLPRRRHRLHRRTKRHRGEWLKTPRLQWRGVGGVARLACPTDRHRRRPVPGGGEWQNLHSENRRPDRSCDILSIPGKAVENSKKWNVKIQSGR